MGKYVYFGFREVALAIQREVMFIKWISGGGGERGGEFSCLTSPFVAIAVFPRTANPGRK